MRLDLWEWKGEIRNLLRISMAFFSLCDLYFFLDADVSLLLSPDAFCAHCRTRPLQAALEAAQRSSLEALALLWVPGERIWLGWLGWGSTLSLFSQGQDTGHMACVHPIGRMEARSPRRRWQFFLPQWKWCPVPISGKPCTSWRAFLGSFSPVTSRFAYCVVFVPPFL